MKRRMDEIIETLTKEDKFVYHYTKAGTALDYVLKGHALKLGNYTNTNDPKETKTWQCGLGSNEKRDWGKYSIEELSDWLSGELKQRARLACFSTDARPLTGDHLADIFKRGYCKPRMWAQYAENHAGVCLIFDRQRLSDLIDLQLGSACLILKGAVQYVDRGIMRKLDEQEYMINIDLLESLGPEKYVRAHLLTHYKVLFFEKMSDWKDESEYRWVVFSDAKADVYVNYDDALVGIMFGENTEVLMIQQIMDLTEAWGLRYMGLKWKNCSPWYDYNLRYMPGIKIRP
jgi:hypothetical protein